MIIQLEQSQAQSIKSYTEHSIQIQDRSYDQSLLLSQKRILSNLSIKSLNDLNTAYFKEILSQCLAPESEMKPELLIIGHLEKQLWHQGQFSADLAALNLGLEIMPLGAACRTYNVLLNEGRAILGLFIFP